MNVDQKLKSRGLTYASVEVDNNENKITLYFNGYYDEVTFDVEQLEKLIKEAKKEAIEKILNNL